MKLILRYGRFKTPLIRCLLIGGIVLLIGLTLKQAFLMKTTDSRVLADSPVAVQALPPPDYEAIFGPYEGKDKPLQESGGNFQLTGVFATQDPAQGSAVISYNGQKARLVAVGDSPGGGVKLFEVYPDRVILEQAGARSVLHLPKKSI